MITRSLFSLALLVALGAESHAQSTVASFPGSACVPADATTRFNRHQVDNAAVQYAPAQPHSVPNVDPIVLTCGIRPFGYNLVDGEGAYDYHLRIVYRDSTGTSASAFVRAQLYRLPIDANPPIDAPTATPVLLATVNSNSSPATTVNVASASFTHDFDFEQGIYWIRIEIDRSNVNQTVVIHAVYIWTEGSDNET